MSNTEIDIKMMIYNLKMGNRKLCEPYDSGQNYPNNQATQKARSTSLYLFAMRNYHRYQEFILM